MFNVNNYLFASCIHLCGIFLYQNTGEIDWLAVSAAMLAWSTLMYTLGVACLISPELEVEVDDKDYITFSQYGNRGILQVVTLALAYIAFIEGYQLIAGVVALQATTVLLSCIVSLWAQGKVEKE